MDRRLNPVHQWFDAVDRSFAPTDRSLRGKNRFVARMKAWLPRMDR